MNENNINEELSKLKIVFDNLRNDLKKYGLDEVYDKLGYDSIIELVESKKFTREEKQLLIYVLKYDISKEYMIRRISNILSINTLCNKELNSLVKNDLIRKLSEDLKC